MVVFLAGMMGSGKSTVGPLLARRLGVSFADLDARIAAAAGMAVADIFASEGEAGFRQREARALADAAREEGVIALGGGALVRPQNRDLVRSAGWLVWLAAPVEELARRLGDGAGRPLLGGRPPAEALRALLVEREPHYRQADLTIDTAGRPPEDVAGEIARWIASA